jgi:hypothetical protein
MVHTRTPSLERLAFALVCFVGLGPVLAVALWRPLVAALGSDPSGLAPWVVVGALITASASVALVAWGLRRDRQLVAGGVACTLALGLGVGVAGAAGGLGLLSIAAACLWLAPRMLEALPAFLDGSARRHPVGALLWVVACLACMFVTARMSVFMGDPAFLRYAMLGSGSGLQHHLCFTAYVHAAELIRAGVDNVYDLSLVPSEGLPETAAHMAPFDLDRYGYPPQFLLVPLALTAVVEDFLAQRALWFGLNGVLFAWTLWKLAAWVGPRQGRVALVATPLLWTLAAATFQVGNVQHAVLAVSVLAMIAFEEQRERFGGALLATATLAKIAPGILGVVLLVARRWRAAAWTVAFAVLITAASLLVMGWGPFAAFFDYHLPRISSGEAYDFLDDNRREIFNNLAAFGIPFKLEASGVEIDAWAVAPAFGNALTVIAFVMAATVGFRVWRGGQSLERRALASMWLAVLTLGALRSPMAPPYVNMGVFWAMTLVAAELRGVRAWSAWVAAMLLLLLQLPGPEERPMWISLVTQGWLYLLVAWLVLRRWPPVDEAPGSADSC